MEITKKRVILIGAGSRGMNYTGRMQTHFPDEFEVVAVAEPIENRRNFIKERHNIPDNMCFESWEPLLDMPKFADLVVVATMDRDHFAPAMAAIDKGYPLLLEKPVAPTPEECRKIQKAAEDKGVFVLVCHVLRYTKFFIALKNIIDSGEIGDVMNIHHIEGVGNVHQSHSFVRGNWGNSEESSFMLLQKSCHDMDILAWLIGKKCKRAQSFGSLSYFKRENAPEGSPEYCIEGCPVADSCNYNAVKLYLESDSSWFRKASTKNVAPTDDDVRRAITETQYGKCVYKCSNNVVDHQVVNLEFEDNVTVSFTMSAFNHGGRFIRIMGTKGEIEAKMEGNEINVYRFDERRWHSVDCNGVSDQSIVSGHGGGDDGIIFALRDLMDGKASKSGCGIAESCENHMIAFAAEESRKSGRVVSLDEYE